MAGSLLHYSISNLLYSIEGGFSVTLLLEVVDLAARLLSFSLIDVLHASQCNIATVDIYLYSIDFR